MKSCSFFILLSSPVKCSNRSKSSMSYRNSPDHMDAPQPPDEGHSSAFFSWVVITLGIIYKKHLITPIISIYGMILAGFDENTYALTN